MHGSFTFRGLEKKFQKIHDWLRVEDGESSDETLSVVACSTFGFCFLDLVYVLYSTLVINICCELV